MKFNKGLFDFIGYMSLWMPKIRGSESDTSRHL